MTTRLKQPHSTDELMRNIARTLLRDFRTNLNDPSLFSDFDEALSKTNIAEIRGLTPTVDMNEETYLFKCKYQLSNLLKRHRFEKDLFTDQELTDQAIAKFVEVQDHLRSQSYNYTDRDINVVIRSTQHFIRKTLGGYSDDEHRRLCRFGRRASVGIPSRKACEAERWEIPLTGSHEQISWFDSEMSQIACVQEYWAKQKDSDPNGSIYREIDSLKLTLVPKTFKSLRSIMPNTTIGSYMSFGLGIMMRNRLRRIGYDISNLQMKHRDLAQCGSALNTNATADLSSASDTISVALVNLLFPDDWKEILHKSRICKVELPNGQCVESETFCTMGIGYTFPLQTLVFLALLKSIHFRFFPKMKRATISVYGDDMIYPPYMHSHVVKVFSALGFMINLDKTYHDGEFRESCGGDYYRGVDVRPFQPRNGATFVSGKAYEAVLYKCINGLLMRWTEYEVRGTLQFLMSEVAAVTRKAKLVPNDFPTDAGIVCSSTRLFDFLIERTDVAKPRSIGHGLYRFSYLRLKTDLRKETRHEPYYWLALSGNCTILPDGSDWTCLQRDRSLLQDGIDHLVGVRDNPTPLLWKESDLTTRSKLTGRRLRRMEAYVTVSHTGFYQRQSGVSCFEIRR